MKAAVFDATTNLKVVRTGGGAPEAAGSLNPFAGLAAPAADSILTRRNSIPVALLGATLGGMMLGAPTTIEAATTIFDRTSFANSNSDVARSSESPTVGSPNSMTGSQVSLAAAFQPTNYNVVVSSDLGEIFSTSNIGTVELNIFKHSTITGQYELVSAYGSGFSVTALSGTNQHDLPMHLLSWEISGLDLAAGDYIFAPYQSNIGDNVMFTNYVDSAYSSSLGAPSVRFKSSMGDLDSVNFQSSISTHGIAPGRQHLADSLLVNYSVPEPSVAALVGLGCLAALMRRRRA